jgi:hypothetical protein
VTPSQIREKVLSLLPELEGIKFQVEERGDISEAGGHVFVPVVVDIRKELLFGGPMTEEGKTEQEPMSEKKGAKK